MAIPAHRVVHVGRDDGLHRGLPAVGNATIPGFAVMTPIRGDHQVARDVRELCEHARLRRGGVRAGPGLTAGAAIGARCPSDRFTALRIGAAGEEEDERRKEEEAHGRSERGVQPSSYGTSGGILPSTVGVAASADTSFPPVSSVGVSVTADTSFPPVSRSACS